MPAPFRLAFCSFHCRHSRAVSGGCDFSSITVFHVFHRLPPARPVLGWKPMRMLAKITAPLAGCAAMLMLATPLAAQKMPDGNPDADEVVMIRSADEKMNAAIAEAQATLPRWLELLDDPPANIGDFSFKFPLEGVEHIWVGNVARDGDVLTGQLANNPHAPGWALGDAVRVPLSDVSDWGYWDAKGNSHGYFTIRVMLDYMSAEEAAAVRDYYGW